MPAISENKHPDTIKPLNSDDLFNLLSAEFATYRGQYDKALDFYLTPMRRHPSAYLAERSTRLSMYQKRFEDMLESAKIWTATDNNNPQAYFFLSLAHANHANPRLALKAMLKVQKHAYTTDFTRLTLLLKDNTERQYYLQQLLILPTNQDNTDTLLALATLYKDLKQYKKSLYYITTALNTRLSDKLYLYAAQLYIAMDKPDLAMSMYQKITQQQPSNSELRLQYAQLATHHNTATAIEQFEVLRLQMFNTSIISLNLGLLYLHENNISKAKPIFEQLLKQDKHRDISHYYLGQIANINQQAEQALIHFLAIESSPERSRAREYIANIYIEQKKYAKAQRFIDSELLQAADKPYRERLNILKALLLQYQGENEKAYQHISHQISQNPHSTDARYSRAMLAEMQNNLPQMETDLRYIINQDPNSTLALNALGYTLATKTNRLNEAHQLIQQALNISPADPAVLDSMGWVLYRMGQWQQAKDYLQLAMQQLPDADVVAHLAEVLWMLGHKEDATSLVKEALHQTPDHIELNETINRLNIPL